jgi:[ribosomal protein S5]-alanine N-acetyltransferase
VIFETQRLRIRPLAPEDLPVIHGILDRTFGDGSKVDDQTALQERRSWLQWSALNQEWFPKLHQPPYGERAIVLKETNTLVGAVGLVPCLDVFEQIPALRCADQVIGSYATPEVGLFWVIDPQHQRHGYATEAAQAMIDFAFTQLRLKRIIATTEYDNEASQAVMRKLGMQLERNPLPDPDWLQVVGILENQGVLHVH